DDQVPDHRESAAAKGLDINRVTVLEMAHVELAHGCLLSRPVRDAVHYLAAGAADAFTAVAVEGDGLPVCFHQTLVHDVEHLEERHVGADVPRLIPLKPAVVPGPLLAPNV